MGVETFDEEFREKVMVKGMKGASRNRLQNMQTRYACCLDLQDRHWRV